MVTLRREAMPQSWRPFSHDLVQHFGDAVIVSEVGKGGRQRNYEVWTYGALVGTAHSLDEAKRVVEDVYGPLTWQRRRNVPYEVIHYYFGPTTEFTEPTTFYVVDSLPRLGSVKVGRVFYHVTDDPEFAIDLTYQPEDVYADGGAGGRAPAGLFVTDDVKHWHGRGSHVVILEVPDDISDWETIWDDDQREWFLRPDHLRRTKVVGVDSTESFLKRVGKIAAAQITAAAVAQHHLEVLESFATATREFFQRDLTSPTLEAIEVVNVAIEAAAAGNTDLAIGQAERVRFMLRDEGYSTAADLSARRFLVRVAKALVSLVGDQPSAGAPEVILRDLEHAWEAALASAERRWAKQQKTASRPLYHGTFWLFSPGEGLLPANQVPGGSTYIDMGQAQDRVHLTHDIELAYFWAVIATGARGFGRPVVFEVTAEESYSQRIHDDHLGPIEEVLAPTATIVRNVTDQAYRAAEPHFDEWADLLLDNLPVGRAAPFIKHFGKLNKTASSVIEIRESPWHVTAVAWDGDEVVGALQVSNLANYVGHVERVYVRPSYRRQGIATSMAGALAQHLRLPSLIHNTDALSPSGAEWANVVTPDGNNGREFLPTWGTDPDWSEWLHTFERSPVAAKLAMPDSEGWWYHVGDGSPMDYTDASQGWVHLGTRGAAEHRVLLHRDRGLYRVRINPRQPVNTPQAPVGDYDANRIDYWLGWGQPRDADGKPTVPRAELSGASDQDDLDRAFEVTGFDPSRHDAIYYRNRVEDPGSVSVMVPVEAIAEVEFVSQQEVLFGRSVAKLASALPLTFDFGGSGDRHQYDGWVAAYLDGVKVGYLDWGVYHDEPEYLWIKMVKVEPEHRGKGIAHAMLDYVIREQFTRWGKPGPILWHDHLTDEGRRWWESIKRDPAYRTTDENLRVISLVALSQTFYHGTNQRFSPGDRIASGLGAQHGDMNDRVWVADNAYVAGKYGTHVYEVVLDAEPRAQGAAHEFYTDEATVVREVSREELREHSNAWWEEAQRNASADGWWYHFGNPNTSRALQGDYVHFGTLSAARERWGNLPRAAPGTFIRVKIAPRDPLNSPSNPMTDDDANTLDQWESEYAYEAGQMPDPDERVPFDDAGTAADVAERWPSYRGAWRHDAIYYRNVIEHPGSISVMVQTSAIVDEEVVDIFANEDNEQQQLFAKVARYTPVTDFALADGEWERDEQGSVLRWVQTHHHLVEDALQSWVGWPSDMRIHMADELDGAPQPSSGSGKKMRAQAAALVWEIEHNARPNDTDLYRSDSRLPAGITSWSESKGVAEFWDGDLYRLPRGAGRGIKLTDYHTWRDDPERQWLIHVTGAPLEKVGMGQPASRYDHLLPGNLRVYIDEHDTTFLDTPRRVYRFYAVDPDDHDFWRGWLKIQWSEGGYSSQGYPPDAAVIVDVWTDPAWRRQGIAKALLDIARDHLHPIQIVHNTELSPSGREWARSVGLKLTSQDLSGWVRDIERSLMGILSSAAEADRERWVYDSHWPEIYLREAQDPAYLDALHANLRRLGFGPIVTLRRVGDLRGRVANASLFPDWGGSWQTARPDADLHEFEVPLEAVVGIGHPEEGEVFFLTASVGRSQIQASALAQTYYHGTLAELEPGDIILPASDHGGPRVHQVSDPDYAYASSKRSNAEWWAEMAWNATDTGEAHVYEVRPLGGVERDPNADISVGRNRGLSAFEGDVRSREGFEVIRRLSVTARLGAKASRLVAKIAQFEDPDVEQLDEVSGDGWYQAANGQTYWGLYGAAGLLVRHQPTSDGEPTDDPVFFLQKRSPQSHHPGTWGIPGGALERGEPPEQGAKREFAEETGTPVTHMTMVGTYDYRPASDWTYTTVVVDADETFEAEVTDEQVDYGWFTLDEMLQLDLHPGLRASLPDLARYASASVLTPA